MNINNLMDEELTWKTRYYILYNSYKIISKNYVNNLNLETKFNKQCEEFMKNFDFYDMQHYDENIDYLFEILSEKENVDYSEELFDKYKPKICYAIKSLFEEFINNPFETLVKCKIYDENEEKRVKEYNKLVKEYNENEEKRVKQYKELVEKYNKNNNELVEKHKEVVKLANERIIKGNENLEKRNRIL